MRYLCRNQVEFFDNEPERDYGNSGTHPGEERPLIGGMVTIVRNPKCSESISLGAFPPPRLAFVFVTILAVDREWNRP